MAVAIYSVALAGLYAALLGVYAVGFFRDSGLDARVTRGALLATVVAHGVFFGVLAVKYGHTLMSSAAEGLSGLALALAVAYLLIEWMGREGNMGFLVLWLPLVFQAMAAVGMWSPDPPVELPRGPVLGLHIATALIGYCAFSLSAAFSVIYLMLYHQIKIHRLGRVFERMPSLETLERMGYRAIYFGLGFLVFSVLLGEHLLARSEGGLVLADPKIVVALVSIGVYALAVVMRGPMAIRGKRFALTSIAGFALILFSLLVLDRFLPGFHNFQ